MGVFTGKVAIVTGSTQGIGYAIAKRLGLDGAKVVVSSRKEGNVETAVKSLEEAGVGYVYGAVCHVGNEQDRQTLVSKTVEKFGKIDILVSNAGINPHYGSILDVPDSVWDKLFDVNVKSGFSLSKMALPHMNKGGSIIYVSSIAGYTPLEGISAYGVTKTALLGLTKAMAAACADKGIRVNCLAPGIIKTDFSKALWDGPDPEAEKQASSSILLKRMGTSDECAGTVAFLASPDASYITGETILVGGGMNARL